MAFSANTAPHSNSTFRQTAAGFLGASGLPFVDFLNENLIARVFAKHGGIFGRTYTTAIVLWAFMGQVLRDGKEASCQSAVARISGHLGLRSQDDVDPDTRDYCRARAKLPEAALHELTTTIANEAERLVEPKHLRKGRHAKLIDGSTFMMPDTPKNQAVYPQNPAQKPGVGFPLPRFVVVLSLATACVIDCAIAEYKGKETGETALLRQILGCFCRGDVAVADRYYGNYWLIALLMQAGVNVCFRKHQNRHIDFRRGRRLGKNDHIVTWHRPNRPSWMSKELYDSMPNIIELHEIRYVITKPGRKQEPFIIATTMTDVESDDAVQYEDLAELFGFRRNAELDIRSIKTHLNLNHLRCKSPDMVRREFWVTMLAYNAIRATSLGSAWMCGTRPREISFVSCCQFVLAGRDVIHTMTAEARRAYCVSRLGQIGKCLVGKRSGRIEPRVRKKRGSNYNLMIQPRQVLQAKLATADNSFVTSSYVNDCAIRS